MHRSRFSSVFGVVIANDFLLQSFIKSTLKPNSPPKKQIRPWAEERRAKIAREERRIAAELLASSQDEDVASDDTTLVSRNNPSMG